MFDVAIVGAGISGLHSAEILANAGLSVVVLEKNSCVGGSFGENLEGFPEYHYSKLGLEIPASPSKNLALYFGDGNRKTASHFQFEKPVIRIVKRGPSSDSIDSFLVKRALKAGAAVKYNEKFSEIRNTKQGILALTTAGGGYEAKILVAADGVFSSVKKLSNTSQLGRTEGVGYIAKMQGVRIGRSEIVGIFNYRLAPGAYCYIIGYPSEDFATVGLTLRPAYTSASVHEYFQSFVKYLPEILCNASIVDETRGFVTLGARDRKLVWNVENRGEPNIVFVGEAGGFQDPTLAFGLYPALNSAALASGFIQRALISGNLRVLDGYQETARQDLIREERRKLRFRYLLESLSGQEIEGLLHAISDHPEKVERMLTTGSYLSTVASLFLRSVISQPSLLTIPVKYVRTQQSIHARERAS